MEKVKKFVFEYLHWLIIGGTALLCGIFLAMGHPTDEGYLSVTGGNVTITESTQTFIENAQEAIIEYAETAVPAVIINDKGEEETIEVPTVESIDGGKIEHDENCNEEECGRGAYIYAPTDTYQHFKDYTIGKCWNVDGAYGAQCWDLSSLHSMNYTKDKRVFSTCGTGAAKGMWNCKEQNAGTEYDLVYSVYNTKVGDIAVFGGGTWGHTGVIAGPVVNGYVALLGQNQGGSTCPGGGSSTNIINISIKDFLGAFHPKTYVDPEPEPTPEPTPTPVSDCKTWNVVKGDTMGAIMKKCTGSVDWSSINAYADKWVSQVIKPGQTVFYGWNHGTGVGLYAGDTIRYSE